MTKHANERTIGEAFEHDVTETRARLAAPGTRLVGYALVAVFDDGRDLVTSWGLERHRAGLAAGELESGLDECIRMLDDNADADHEPAPTTVDADPR